MLTPMLVQYLVGLCCVRRNPDAIDVTVGDMVLDTAAGKSRDVDVTVTVNNDDGSVSAFKAYEVKREGQPLDVVTVEQLCMKLRDMPRVTHRGIVSASGFTPAAIAKASAHDVTLYSIMPWTKPLGDQFPAYAGIGPPCEFLRGFSTVLLCWEDYRIQFVCPDGPSSFVTDNATPLYSSDGSLHEVFPSVAIYSDALLYRSTGILYQLEPAQTILRTFPLTPMAGVEGMDAGPAWPHTHTIDVAADTIAFKLDSRLVSVRSVNIGGKLQWQGRNGAPDFHILERVPGPEVFAGAAVLDWGRPEGKMSAFLFAPDSREINIHTFQLLEKHKHAIRKLKLDLPQRAP